MAERCADLLNVNSIMSHFHVILGPDLKGTDKILFHLFPAVTGASQQIDEVLEKVAATVELVESFPHDVFDKRYETSWETVMAKFKENVAQIEAMAKQFIDKSFGNLRSAEAAFAVLKKFKSMKGQSTMSDNFVDVLNRYRTQLARTQELFHSFQKDPLVPKNQPPLAGAIAWSRLLFHKIKQPMLKFQTIPGLCLHLQILIQELLQKGADVKNDYISIARSIRNFEIEVTNSRTPLIRSYLKLGVMQSSLLR